MKKPRGPLQHRGFSEAKVKPTRLSSALQGKAGKSFIIELCCLSWGNCMVPMMNKAWIEEMAKKYDDGNTESMVELEKRIFEAIKNLGPSPSYLTKAILLDIVRWKAARATGHASKNEDRLVIEVTRVSLSARHERLKIGVLTLMKGVRYRMASTILYFCFPERYPIMDWRAWDSLKALGMIQGGMEDTFECWQEYSGVCRKLADRYKVPLRTLDKALWAYKGRAK